MFTTRIIFLVFCCRLTCTLARADIYPLPTYDGVSTKEFAGCSKGGWGWDVFFSSSIDYAPTFQGIEEGPKPSTTYPEMYGTLAYIAFLSITQLAPCTAAPIVSHDQLALKDPVRSADTVRAA